MVTTYHASNVVHDEAECLLCNELCSRSNGVETSLQLPQLNRMPELLLFSISLLFYLLPFFFAFILDSGTKLEVN